jgi:hypothetical protein
MHAFAPFFHVVDRTLLSNQRVLLLFERGDMGINGSGPQFESSPA